MTCGIKSARRKERDADCDGCFWTPNFGFPDNLKLVMAMKTVRVASRQQLGASAVPLALSSAAGTRSEDEPWAYDTVAGVLDAHSESTRGGGKTTSLFLFGVVS